MVGLRSSVARVAGFMLILLSQSSVAASAAQELPQEPTERPKKPRSWWKRNSAATASATKPSADGATEAPPSPPASNEPRAAAQAASSMDVLRSLWMRACSTGAKTAAKASRRLRQKVLCKPRKPVRLYRQSGSVPSSPPSLSASTGEAPCCRLPGAEVLVEVSLASDGAKGAGDLCSTLVAVVPLASVDISPASSLGAKRLKAAMAKATAGTRKLVAAVDSAQVRLAAKLKATAAPKVSLSAARAAAKVNGSAMAASFRRRLERLSSMGRRDSGSSKDRYVETSAEL